MSTSPQLNSVSAQVLPKEEKRNYPAKKYRRFNLNFLLTAFVPLLFVGLFNIIIDPYSVFNSPRLVGFNQLKPRKDNNDRVFKAIDITRIKPVTVLIGSSRAKQGLDPNYQALVNSQPAYNLGLNGVNVYEQLRYLEHTIANQKNLKLVILATDFFTFNSSLNNQPVFSESRLEKSHITLQDVINFGFSLDAVSASGETLTASRKSPNQESYSKNGFSPYRNIKKSEVNWRFQAGINDFFTNHANYQLSSKYLADFKKIVEICKEHNITLKVFISPSHATQWEAIRATGRWQTFEQWKREIVKITPILDFSGYNSITTEPISYDMENYTDNSHYTPKVGNLVLNQLLSYQEEKVPDDFGVLITPDNIESHLAKIRANREIWAKNNPDAVKLVQEVKQKYDVKRKSEIK